MAEKPKRTIRKLKCPETKREAKLVIEWREEGGRKKVVQSIQCDNPRLADLDNWDCTWSCWEKISRSKK